MINFTEIQEKRNELAIIELIRDEFEQIWYSNEGARVDAVTKHLMIINQAIFDKLHKLELAALNEVR